jgi:hypothetical protein
MDYKFVVIECGTTAQIQLNATQWQSVCRALKKFVDPYDYNLSEILSENCNRVVLSESDLHPRFSELTKVMLDLSTMGSGDFDADPQYRIDTLRVILFLLNAIRCNVNVAFNFVSNEHDMAVFSTGMYFVGEVSALFEGFPETNGVFEYNNTIVAQYDCNTKFVCDHLGRNIVLQKEPYRIGIIRCDYIFDDKLKEIMFNPEYVRRYYMEKPFRVSKFWNPIELEKDVICFGHIQFEVPHVKN